MPRTRHICIYIYIYIYMMLLIIDVEFLYQFNLGLIAPIFTVSFHEKFEKKNVFKIFKSWQVCDWLAKWIIMLQFMDLRWPRVFRRSNVGLVDYVRSIFVQHASIVLQCNPDAIFPSAILC